jgi:hypothetical protein
MGDDLITVGRDEHLPAGNRRRREPGHSVVEVADETGGTAQVAVIVQQTEPAGPGRVAGQPVSGKNQLSR